MSIYCRDFLKGVGVGSGFWNIWGFALGLYVYLIVKLKA